jgi:hypothetical protein
MTLLLFTVRILKTSLIVFIFTSLAYYFFNSDLSSFNNLNDRQLKLLGLNHYSSKGANSVDPQQFSSSVASLKSFGYPSPDIL